MAHRRARAGRIGLLAMGVVFDAGAESASSPAASPALSLVVLGSGGPGATARAGSSHLVLVDGAPRILGDALAQGLANCAMSDGGSADFVQRAGPTCR